ncbi:hypothetical protein GH714_029624 [Hevea brasiliensis]|uniref:Uncharacterized protein n=1 Tax=Hevea brasiliensis TaxID=3981 RepID=A0A6A6KMA2_HEVBR|nr:hypothetical protein GH714_029624 [Hevea brasiliensis]
MLPKTSPPALASGLEIAAPSTIVGSPIAIGLVSLMKLTVGILASSSCMGIFGILPVKASSILPFFQGSRWLPCNESAPGLKSSDVDKGGTVSCVRNESNTVTLKINGKELDNSGSWLSKVFSFCSEDAKAIFMSAAVSLLLLLALAEPRSIPSTFHVAYSGCR